MSSPSWREPRWAMVVDLPRLVEVRLAKAESAETRPAFSPEAIAAAFSEDVEPLPW